MMRRMWLWMLAGVMVAGAGGLAACKRGSEKAGPGTSAPTIARPARMVGPSTQEREQENRARLLEKFYDLEPMWGQAIVEKTPDGEAWSRYPNGMMIHELRPSIEGLPPQLGQTVSVAYVGTFPGTNQVFDRRDAGNPLTFRMGGKDLIKGFSLGIATMHTGGKRRVLVPPELAYGAAGKPSGNIPGGQALIFEIELLSIKGEAITITLDDLPKFEPLGPPAPTNEPATRP